MCVFLHQTLDNRWKNTTNLQGDKQNKVIFLYSLFSFISPCHILKSDSILAFPPAPNTASCFYRGEDNKTSVKKKEKENVMGVIRRYTTVAMGVDFIFMFGATQVAYIWMMFTS